jgi:hypothetical protein
MTTSHTCSISATSLHPMTWHHTTSSNMATLHYMQYLNNITAASNMTTSHYIQWHDHVTLHPVTWPHHTTRRDNLIPRMALWKQNLLTRTLVAAIAFEIPSLRSYALCETMMPLPESLQSRFPEYVPVASRCVGCHECQQTSSLQGIF